jgi:hypothetical protein
VLGLVSKTIWSLRVVFSFEDNVFVMIESLIFEDK